MSVTYKSIIWNRQKIIYDLALWGAVLIFVLSFIAFQLVYHPDINLQTLIIRSSAIASFFILHIILMIGPLCRIEKRFLPILYNRRHMGVSMFLLALIHGMMGIVQFHTLGDVGPLESLFTANQKYGSISQFPFQILGFSALIILMMMAITSHDFWLKNLSPRVWKVLHMFVYLAYGLIVLHVLTGALQYEDNPIYWVILIIGFLILGSLHVIAGIKEVRNLRLKSGLEKNGFFEVCAVTDINEDCGKTFFLNGENIAIFKYDAKISAVNNVCKHQMGPIGEGKIIDGCITCPWHGYQYLPENGQSPPPFNEKLATYDTKVYDGTVWVNPIPKEEGTFVKPSNIVS